MSGTVSASAPRVVQEYSRILTGVIDTLDLHDDGPDHIATGGR